jgi:L-malate glycosyltransferase
MPSRIMTKRILFLADVNSAHTRKWAELLTEKGFSVGIFSLNPVHSKWFESFPNITIFQAEFGSKTENDSDISKIKYLRHWNKLQRIILEFNPDILHAHYATSYGLLGAMSKFHPFVLSVWGSDVFEFPQKSFLHKALLKFNLKAADAVLSTSNIMAKETSRYTSHPITVTPFGIDLDKFKKQQVKSIFNENDIVIGTIKSLEHIYGIDILIRAFKKVLELNRNFSLKLLIVGGGSKTNDYEDLVNELGIKENVVFAGKVEYEEIIAYHNMIDIFVNVSRNESFGVSVLEASACETPVIASRVGGLVEVVEDNITGILVESENVSEVVKAISKLIINDELRKMMGVNGRIMVQNKFDLSKNVNELIKIYNALLKENILQ